MDREIANLILTELKELNAELKNQGKVQAVHAEILREHTRRSEALEKSYELLREEYKPVQKHVAFVETCLKLAGAITGLCGFTLVVIQIIKSL